MRRLVMLAGFYGITALFLCVPISFAGQAPPQGSTCQAVGSGTICKVSNAFSYGPVDTGIACGSGASPFDIFDQGTGNEFETEWLDQNDNLTKVENHTNFTFGEWSNPLTGAVVPYTQHNAETLSFAVPGDFSTVTITTTGENIYRNPLTHKVVFLNAGRFVMAPDGSLAFQAGPDAFADFFAGDTSAIDGVCAALGT